MKISAAVINRNGLTRLGRCFGALEASLTPFDEVFFVDDNSEDGSAGWVESNYPRVRVIRLARRGGPSAARNAAIAAAGRGLLLLLDCDAEISSGCAGELASRIVSAKALLALPSIHLPSGAVQHGAARTHLLGLAVFYGAWGAAPREPEGPVSSCGATALMVDLDLLPKDLRFDEQLFCACEDGDFAFRAASRGFVLAYAPEASVIHLNASAALEISGRAAYPAEKFFYQARNRRWLVLKNFEARTILATLPLHLVFEAATAAFSVRSGAFLLYLRGVLSFFAGLPAALAERRARLAVRTVADAGLLTAGPLSLRPSVRAGRLAGAFNFLCRSWWGRYARSVSPETGGAEAPRGARVLFLAPQPFYRLRGMCLAQKKCLEALSAAGCRVRLLTFPFGGDLSLPGLRVTRLPVLPFTRDVPIGFSPQKLAYDALLFLYLLVHLPFNRYDVIHACEESAVIAAFFRLFLDFRLVYDMDDVLSRRLRSSGAVRSPLLLRAVALAEGLALLRADSVLTNSADTTACARASRAGGVVFYDHIPPIPAAAARAARAQGGPVITYAGNLEPYQGIGLLLEALADVFKASDARCLIIGGEPAQIAAYSENAAALGISGRMTWAGKMDLEETFSALLSSGVLVSPMTEDKAVPSKVYMYMAAGRPIVATDTANHSSLLRNGSAIIVPASASHLAGAILRVLGDRSLSEGLGRKASGLYSGISGATDISASLARAYGVSRL